MTSSRKTIKEALLTFIEWSRLVEKGCLAISSKRMLKAGAEINSHMKEAPDIGIEEDAYVLCKFLPIPKKLGVITIDNVASFHPVTERGGRLLSVTNPIKFVKLSEPVFESSWSTFCNSKLDQDQSIASQELLKLFAPEDNKKSKRKLLLTPKAKQIPAELFIFPIQEGFVKKYLGTPACGYRVTRWRLPNYLENHDSAKLEEFNAIYTEHFKDFDLKGRLEELRSKPITKPFFSYDFFREFWERMKYCQEVFKSIIDIRILLFFYHYAGMAIDERDINPEYISKDIGFLLGSLQDNQKFQINRAISELGKYIPLNEIVLWGYYSKDERSKVPISSVETNKISLVPVPVEDNLFI